MKFVIANIMALSTTFAMAQAAKQPDPAKVAEAKKAEPAKPAEAAKPAAKKEEKKEAAKK